MRLAFSRSGPQTSRRLSIESGITCPAGAFYRGAVRGLSLSRVTAHVACLQQWFASIPYRRRAIDQEIGREADE